MKKAKKSKKVPKWSGRSELWISPDNLRIFIRTNKYYGEMSNQFTGYFTIKTFIDEDFKFYNGTKFLKEKGWHYAGLI